MEEFYLLSSQGFQVLQELGYGASGRVYLVYHPYSNIGVVAAKVIRNEDFNEQEWNIAGVFEQDPPQIRPFVIRYILAKQFEKHTVILMDYFEGIRYIHSKNLIHRDIKGGNIMLHCQPGSGRVNLKITDFGVVKVNSGDEKTMQMTAIGTEPYMAPELILGNGEQQVRADSKVDIWSLGILFFKLASHRFPCGQLNIQSIITFMNKYQQTRILDRPQNIKNDLLWDLLVRMLQFDRKDRISAETALQHPFFTGEQAMKEITSEQIQLFQTAQQNGDQNISQFETNPSFIFSLTEVQKILGPIDPQIKMNEIYGKLNHLPQQQLYQNQFQSNNLQYNQQQSNTSNTFQSPFYLQQQQQPQQNSVVQFQNLQQNQNSFFQNANIFGSQYLQFPQQQYQQQQSVQNQQKQIPQQQLFIQPQIEQEQQNNQNNNFIYPGQSVQFSHAYQPNQIQQPSLPIPQQQYQQQYPAIQQQQFAQSPIIKQQQISPLINQSPRYNPNQNIIQQQLLVQPQIEIQQQQQVPPQIQYQQQQVQQNGGIQASPPQNMRTSQNAQYNQQQMQIQQLKLQQPIPSTPYAGSPPYSTPQQPQNQVLQQYPSMPSSQQPYYPANQQPNIQTPQPPSIPNTQQPYIPNAQQPSYPISQQQQQPQNEPSTPSVLIPSNQQQQSSNIPNPSLPVPQSYQQLPSQSSSSNQQILPQSNSPIAPDVNFHIDIKNDVVVEQMNQYKQQMKIENKKENQCDQQSENSKDNKKDKKEHHNEHHHKDQNEINDNQINIVNDQNKQIDQFDDEAKILCDSCHKMIPFNIYQLHIDDHQAQIILQHQKNNKEKKEQKEKKKDKEMKKENEKEKDIMGQKEDSNEKLKDKNKDKQQSKESENGKTKQKDQKKEKKKQNENENIKDHSKLVDIQSEQEKQQKVEKQNVNENIKDNIISNVETDAIFAKQLQEQEQELRNKEILNQQQKNQQEQLEITNIESNFEDDIPIQCEQCHEHIPFSQYQLHIDQHLTERQNVQNINRIDLPISDNNQNVLVVQQEDLEDKIRCEQCKLLIPVSNYQQHINKHITERALPPIPPQPLQVPTNNNSPHLNNHNQYKQQNIDEDETKIQCEMCNKQIPHTTYQNHLKLHVAERAYQQNAQMNIHQVKPHHFHPTDQFSPSPEAKNDSLIICDICNKQIQLNNLRSHLMYDHDKRTPVKCEYCRSWVQLKHYKTHTLFHFLDEKIQRNKNMICEICRIEMNPKQYYHHLKTQHKSKQGEIQCRECGTQLYNDVYAQHLYTHKLANKKFMKQAPKKQPLQKIKEIGILDNLANVFRSNDDKEIQCKYCQDQPIFRFKELRQHNNEKHRDNPIMQCIKCKKFYLQSEIPFHKQKHGIFQ